MRLDHLLSKEEEVGVGLLFKCQGGEGAEGAQARERDLARGETAAKPRDI